MSHPNSHRWLAIFFAFGTVMCTLTIVLLLFPGTPLDVLWRVNPAAQSAFRSMGNWSVAVMSVVGMACLFSAIGLWRGTKWGGRMAVLILSINIVGDAVNVAVRHDYRALIGLPIAGAMIFYLARYRKTRHSSL